MQCTLRLLSFFSVFEELLVPGVVFFVFVGELSKKVGVDYPDFLVAFLKLG